jgi:YD repeat-containing protein
MIRASTFLLLPCLVAVLTGCGQPIPRLTRMVEDQPGDDPDIETVFEYDSAIRLAKVVRTEGDDEEQWDFAWESETLVQVTHQSVLGGTQYESEFELTWENGRLVRSERSGDFGGATTFDYDDAGLLVKTTTESGEDEQETDIKYDSSGAITSFEGEGSAVEFDRSDGAIVGVVFDTADGRSISIDIAYDEDKGRIATTAMEFSLDVAGTPTTFTTTRTFDYDLDGRIVEIAEAIETGGEVAAETNFSLEYEDGSAVGIDVTSSDILPTPLLFDLKGKSHETIDRTTRIPRMAFDSF